MSTSLSLEDLLQAQKELILKQPQERIQTSSPTQPMRPHSIRSTVPPASELSNAIVPYKRKMTALERVEESIGGRQQMIDTLSSATLDKRQQHFVNLLSDPKRERDTINTIARDAGMKVSQVMDMYRAAAFAGTMVEALTQISNSLPEVVKDITAKAVDSKIECPRCFGSQYEAEGVMCMQCNGKGQIFRESDLDRQKIVLESAGIIKKNAGVNVQVNQNQQIGIMQPGSFFSRFVKDSDQAAYDIGDVIEAETVEGSENVETTG